VIAGDKSIFHAARARRGQKDAASCAFESSPISDNGVSISSVPITHLTPEEYLELERAADEKHEYWYGGMYAMAGGLPPHSLIINNVQSALTNLLRDRDCLVFNADLRVSVRWDTLITYPDATIVSDPPNYVDDLRDTVTNPTLVVEVLSPSTARKDRGDKTLLYRQVPSMREILLVEPAPVWIEHYWKLPNGHWELETVTDPAAVLRLPTLDCELPVAEIYRKVDRLTPTQE
jgi:Uma2 family endonuclease